MEKAALLPPLALPHHRVAGAVVAGADHVVHASIDKPVKLSPSSSDRL
jgi:hypothetical protein